MKRAMIPALFWLLFLFDAILTAETTHARVVLPKANGTIVLDANLSDPIWIHALRLDKFYEISPGDNSEPVVQTSAYLAYDERFLYVAIHCMDPRPEEIRATYSDRDLVFSDQDFVQFDIDTRNDEKSSFIFRVNPLGVLADAIFSEATGLDDFSPDFSFEVKAGIVSDGWVVEYQIPLSSLRYSNSEVQEWGITVYRNYPRQFRRQMTSNPIPRGAQCWLCYDTKLTKITDLPPSRYFLIVPFATAQRLSTNEETSTYDWNTGADLKWIPRNDLTIDATWNPDFAQIEADIPQITVNNRFALFYPEKRNFFLEGADLLTTPMRVVHTRNITSPAWGARMTHQIGNSAYTFLIAEDEGGGSRINPGPVFSTLVPQGDESLAVIGRWKTAVGKSYAGFVLTDREQGSSFNRVLGPDIQWRPNDTNQLIAQWVLSTTRDPDQQLLTDHALSISWQHSAPKQFLQAVYQRLGHHFRADNGFIPQVGVERKAASSGYRFYPEGWLRFIQTSFTWDSFVEIGEDPVSRSTYFAIDVTGRWGLTATLKYNLKEQVRTATRLNEFNYLGYNIQIQPSRFFSSIQLQGTLGDQVDVVHERVGKGGTLGFLTTLRPGIHLTAELQGERQWLNVAGNRLFTADVAQAKFTYNFNTRVFLRTIGQYERIHRDVALYSEKVDGEEGSWNGSILAGYRFNWQTVLYAGYSTERILMERHRYENTGSNFFFKISYAFES